MELYKKDLTTFTEITDEELELGLENGTIEAQVIEEGKSAEEIYNKLERHGFDVAIHNGVYCKVVYGTFEAINPIPPTIKYVEVEHDSQN